MCLSAGVGPDRPVRRDLMGSGAESQPKALLSYCTLRHLLAEICVRVLSPSPYVTVL